MALAVSKPPSALVFTAALELGPTFELVLLLLASLLSGQRCLESHCVANLPNGTFLVATSSAILVLLEFFSSYGRVSSAGVARTWEPEVWLVSSSESLGSELELSIVL